MTEKEVIRVRSEKYDVAGVIFHYPFVTTLELSYQGKDIRMGIPSSRFGTGKTYEEIGEELIDSYIENLNSSDDRVMLHYWHLEKCMRPDNDYRIILRGNVSGHPKLPDTGYIATSSVRSMMISYESSEYLIRTKNTLYHCPLEYIDIEGFEENETQSYLPFYDEIKAKYASRKEPKIEPGKILLVLSDFDRYYYHSCYCRPSKDSNPLKFRGHAHIGTYQDSFLVTGYNSNEDFNNPRINLRYFPHYQNIKFYRWNTEDMPVYIENIGSSVLYCRTFEGLIKLEPGQRRKVCKRTAEKEDIPLPSGDLYPAEVINLDDTKE